MNLYFQQNDCIQNVSNKISNYIFHCFITQEKNYFIESIFLE